MERAKAYLWLLTVIMGLAINKAVIDLVSLLTGSPGINDLPLWNPLVRFAIFLILSVRGTLAAHWYFDKTYISKNLQIVPPGYFFDLLIGLANFLIFVPLAATITAPVNQSSRFSYWLNQRLMGGQEVPTFDWILALLLTFLLFWPVLKLISWYCGGQPPRRIQVFWALLNFFTFLFCAVVFLVYKLLQMNLQNAEIWIFAAVLIASALDFWGTIVESSPLSKWLSP